MNSENELDVGIDFKKRAMYIRLTKDTIKLEANLSREEVEQLIISMQKNIC